MAGIIMIVVMVGMIFFMQRQQKKQATERQNQLNAVKKGDEVVTIGGLYATVDEVDLDAKKIVLDADGIYLTFELSAIKSVVAKASAVETSESSEKAVEEVTETEASAVESTTEETESAIEEN